MAITTKRLFMSIASSRGGRLLILWTVALFLLGGMLFAIRSTRSPLNDPDMAYQRPGFLDAHGAPFPAPQVTAGIPSPGTRAVVFFTRPELLARLEGGLLTGPLIRDDAALAVVVAGTLPTAEAAGVHVVADPDGRLAKAYDMPIPRDGGPPVGYAIVDSQGRVRYRTLDPEMEEHLWEVQTMLRDTP